MVHLRSGISNDLDVFWEEFVSVLQALVCVSEAGKVTLRGQKVPGRFSFSPDRPKLQEQ